MEKVCAWCGQPSDRGRLKNVEQPWLMSTYDVIHKTGSTQCITKPPEEDQAMATGNIHKNFGEDWTCTSKKYDRGQTHTHTQTCSLQYSASLSGFGLV